MVTHNIQMANTETKKEDTMLQTKNVSMNQDDENIPYY